MRNSFVEEQKNKVKNVVDQVVQHIKFRRDTTEQNIKDNLKKRVYEAVKLCQYLYETYHDTKSQDELIVLIKESLRTIRFNHERGDYFIYDMPGNHTLLPNNPELEGKNLLNLLDDKGQHPISQLLVCTSTKNGEIKKKKIRRGSKHWSFG